MKKILIINGPNLNMLGKREPSIYGSCNIDDLNQKCVNWALDFGMEAVTFQSNFEAEIIEKIHSVQADQGYVGIIINAAAYSHTSIAILDALKSVSDEANKLPIIEVHISNIYKREDFRHQSYISRCASGVVSGFGIYGYKAAIEQIKILNETTPEHN